ncbi:MAG: sterol desaturase/sphingolipid hydroxylase (fatty acid hydroxylase superfamily) [Parvicellaceae bacterium]|jgi:sterol desaturase/sphingolipid hydroxylase (fatty acid hydroxylase superfamily)
MFENLDEVKSVFDFDDPTVFAIPFFLLFIGIELFIDLRKNLKLYNKKDSISSIGMGLGSLAIGLGMKTLAFLAYNWIYHNYALLPQINDFWWVWIILLFADDFTFYWHHRLSHSMRVLWAAHVNHHSSVHINFATALRQSWVEVLYKYIWWIWLPFVGFHPVYIMTMMAFSLIYQFIQHTELVKKLGPYEWIFNTPSHHRVHHATQTAYLDRNHAGILIIWDRLFGTYQVEKEDDHPVYGITENIKTYNLFKIASHEYIALFKDVKRAPKFKDKLNYLFQPPGWSHDGELKTSKRMRELENESKK